VSAMSTIPAQSAVLQSMPAAASHHAPTGPTAQHLAQYTPAGLVSQPAAALKASPYAHMFSPFAAAGLYGSTGSMAAAYMQPSMFTWPTDQAQISELTHEQHAAVAAQSAMLLPAGAIEDDEVTSR